jgi:hypothetical protein
MFPKDLSTFTVAGITELRAAAHKLLTDKRAGVPDPENIDDATLAELKELKEYVALCDDTIKNRQERAAEFAATEAPEAAPVAVETPAVETGTETAVEGEVQTGTGETVVAAATDNTPAVQTGREGGTPVRSVQVADVAQVPVTEPIPVTNEDTHFAIKAAADVPGFVTGQEIDWVDLGKAFEARARAYSPTNGGRSRGPRLQHGFALIERQMPEHQQILDNESDFSLKEKLERVQAEALAKSKENNALVAAAGWCAPSETIYSTVNPVTTDGLLDLPEVVARRGGIRHNQGINWNSFFGGTYPALDANVPGMTLLTEAQVIADTAKTCLEIDCPPFIDERLNVAALCLTGSLLQNRGYPEYVAEFTRGAMAAFAHLVNREVIDIIEDGSTATVLTAVDPWQVEGAVVSSVMSAVEMAVVDMRYRLRLSMTTPIEFIFPEWIRAQMRADWIRRNAAQPADLADAEIASMFARRGANVRYVYDWQDAFTGTTNGPGVIGNAGIVQLPNTVRFIAYPAGTWILARQDVIRLDTVYDSVNLQLNQVTQLFMEDGYLPMRMGPLSRVYTLPIAPSGVTGAQRTAGTGGNGGAAMVYADTTP